MAAVDKEGNGKITMGSETDIGTVLRAKMTLQVGALDQPGSTDHVCAQPLRD